MLKTVKFWQNYYRYFAQKNTQFLYKMKTKIYNVPPTERENNWNICAFQLRRSSTGPSSSTTRQGRQGCGMLLLCSIGASGTNWLIIIYLLAAPIAHLLFIAVVVVFTAAQERDVVKQLVIHSSSPHPPPCSCISGLHAVITWVLRH